MLKGVSTSRASSVSKAWEIGKAHQGAYSGGKVQVSADGSFIACLYESDVSFVNVEEGVVTKRLKQGDEAVVQEEIVCFALHPDDLEIVTASRSLLLRHWEIATGVCKRTIKAHNHLVLCMDYDRTGTLVATGSSDSTVRVWDVEGGYCTHNFRGHKAIISVVAFHPDPDRLVLVSGSEDSSIRVWDLTKQACTCVMEGHMSYVTSLAFLSDGSGFISGGRDRVLNLWNLDSKEVLKTFPVYEEVEGLQIIPQTGEFAGKFPDTSGELLAVAGKNGVVRVFATELQGERGIVEGKKPLGVKTKQTRGKAGSASSSGKYSIRCVMTQDNVSASHLAGYTELLLDAQRGGFIAVTSDHNMIMLSPSSLLGKASPGGEARPLLVSRRQIVGYNDEIIDIKSIPNGVLSRECDDMGTRSTESWIAVATNSPQVRLFELGGFSCRLLDGHTDTVLALDVAPDGRHLCTSSKDRTCLLWDLELGIPVMRWSGHTDAVGAIAASCKPGPWMASGSSGGSAFVVSGAADRTLQRWDVPSKALVELEAGARTSRISAEMEAAGLAVDEGDGAHGTAKAKERCSWKPPSPLVETAKQSVRAHEKDINCIAVSPNDAIVASASQDRTVRLWSSRKLEPLGVLKGHKRGVWKVEFSPVDRCVATCSGDRTVKLWSITDYSCLKTFQGHTASVLSVAFVTAGAQLMSGGADGLVKLWTIRSHECESTLDSHVDKVWALATAKAPQGRSREEDGDNTGKELEGPNKGVVLVTGGADSTINLWRDVTAQQEEEAIAEREAMLLKEQDLQNSLRGRDFGSAIALALELKRPLRLWSVFRDAMTEGLGDHSSGPVTSGDDAATEMASRNLDKFVASWNMDTVSQCLGYCRDWNTNAKKAIVVQAVVGSILRCFRINSLKDLPGCDELVRTLLPYSERHFQRLDRLLQSSYLVEHTLASMQMLVASEKAVVAGPVVTQTNGLNRSLVRELKRLREESKSKEKIASSDATAQADLDASSEDEGTGGVPESEVVDGRTVFNVVVEPSAPSTRVDSEDDSAADSSDEKMVYVDSADHVNATKASTSKLTERLESSRGEASKSGSSPTAEARSDQPEVHTEKTEQCDSASSGRKARKRRKSRGLPATPDESDRSQATAPSVVSTFKSESPVRDGAVIADCTTKDDDSGMAADVSATTVGDGGVVGNLGNEVNDGKGGVTMKKRRRKSSPVAIVDSDQVSSAVAVVNDEAGDSEVAGRSSVMDNGSMEGSEGYLRAGDGKSEVKTECKVASTASGRKRLRKKARRKSTMS